MDKRNNEKYLNRIAMLGLKISYYRKLRGYTQEELADIVGVSRIHISKVETPNIDSTLSLRTLFDIADALDVDPKVFFEIN